MNEAPLMHENDTGRKKLFIFKDILFVVLKPLSSLLKGFLKGKK